MATAKTTTKSSTSAKASADKKAVNLEATVFTQKGAKAGTIALSEKVFGLAWNADLVHQVVVSMLSNARAGTAHTKDRSEVSGGGKKPWKQKGTGQARHGSTRSPIWVGGGITFGPRSDKDYSKKINKKMRVKALFTVLSKKYADGAVLFLDTLALGSIKTKDAAEIMNKLSGVDGFSKIGYEKKTATLIALPAHDEVVEKSFANLPGVTVALATELNAVDAMKFNHLVLVGAEAVEALSGKMK
jgi:large subunit ribosomal protein L4